ncbi:hypothetical protein C4J81_01855 [Deltaproteobacteria bacterium Smac51]|nr:hypothetical protein C4J81_01855 [Deltaproteobacteria bacterium Smac51]
MKHFIRSLPLVASALGRKYGIEVIIGGDQAATDGQTIYLPALPLDSPPELVALARGYLDHEASHIRETNMKQVKAAKLSPLEHHIWNIIEDQRVEKILGDLFPGCRKNFVWLIKRIFLVEPETPTSLEQAILNWILLEARRWSVPELARRVDFIAAHLDQEEPGLLDVIRPIMERIKASCPSTKAAIKYAREIVEALKNLCDQMKSGSAITTTAPDGSTEARPGDCDADDANQKHANAISAIESLLSLSKPELPQDFGSVIGTILTESKPENPCEALKVAQVATRETGLLPPSALEESRAATLAMRRRLQSLIQSLVIKKVNPGRSGRLDAGALHKLYVGDRKIFRRSGVRVGLDTAIHLLIDASGSMRCQIDLVSMAAYSLCRSLSEARGINIGASIFPGNFIPGRNGNPKSWDTISPVLRHGETLHQRFQLEAAGGTPMGEAIWWAMQQMAPLRQSRKIIFILTDGEPDFIPNTKAAIAEAHRIGFELYGLGMGCESIKELLPGRSTVIHNLSQLPQCLFHLMGQAIVRSN